MPQGSPPDEPRGCHDINHGAFLGARDRCRPAATPNKYTQKTHTDSRAERDTLRQIINNYHESLSKLMNFLSFGKASEPSEGV